MPVTVHPLLKKMTLGKKWEDDIHPCEKRAAFAAQQLHQL